MMKLPILLTSLLVVAQEPPAIPFPQPHEIYAQQIIAKLTSHPAEISGGRQVYSQSFIPPLAFSTAIGRYFPQDHDLYIALGTSPTHVQIFQDREADGTLDAILDVHEGTRSAIAVSSYEQDRYEDLLHELIRESGNPLAAMVKDIIMLHQGTVVETERLINYSCSFGAVSAYETDLAFDMREGKHKIVMKLQRDTTLYHLIDDGATGRVTRAFIASGKDLQDATEQLNRNIVFEQYSDPATLQSLYDTQLDNIFAKMKREQAND